MKPKILLIEDDAGILESYKIYLSSYFDVDLAQNIEDAKKLLNQNHYSSIILDLAFPNDRLAGIEFLNYMKDNALFTPTIILSAHIDDSTLEKLNVFYDDGLCDIISKGEKNTRQKIFKALMATTRDIAPNVPLKDSMPYAIKTISIKNYFDIRATNVENIPANTKWIFLTGENAFGKTAVLQAIVTGFLGEHLLQRESMPVTNAQISIDIVSSGRTLLCGTNSYNESFNDFAAYGPARLILQSKESQNTYAKNSTKTYSIFNTDGILKNIEYDLINSHLDNNEWTIFSKKILLQVLPYVENINVIKKNSQWEVTYQEKDSEKFIPFDALATGPKSLFAMVGDLLIRFRNLQPEVDNPSDYRGLVLIDEVDNHLHPNWQRKMPELLSNIFPKIQFIVSTHSVLPFLGAPENSVFLKVNRSKDTGITLERLDIDISRLLPNTILTSPIFDMSKISQVNLKNIPELRTEEHYDDIVRHDEIEQELKTFNESDTIDLPDELFS